MNKKKNFKKAMAFILSAAIAATGGISIPSTKKPVKAVENTGVTYNAYTTFQIIDIWTSRSNWWSTSDGLMAGLPCNPSGLGTYNYLNQYLVYSYEAKNRIIDGGIKDATMTKNGNYTLEMNNMVIDGGELPLSEKTQWNILSISTDIPTTIRGVKCTDVKVYLDDETTPFAEMDEAPVEERVATHEGSYEFYIFNSYSDMDSLLDSAAEKYKRFPSKSLRIEYTISGVDFTLSSNGSTQPTESYVPRFDASLTSYDAIWKTDTLDESAAKPSEKIDMDIKAGDEIEVAFTVEGDSDAEEAFPNFTATLNSYGGFWGWEASTGSDDTWKVNVTAPGEYRIKVIAPSNITYGENVFSLETDLTNLPYGYWISGKTVSVAGKEYDWSQAMLHVNNEHLRLSIWNEWQQGDNVGCPLEKWSENPENASTTIYKTGDYTLKGIAMQDANSNSGALIINTELTTLPANYSIVGKSVKVAGKEYDWSKAKAYRSGRNVCLSLWNAQSDAENANPIEETILVKSGDIVEATFSVTSKSNLNPDFTASLNSIGAAWEKLTPSLESLPTEIREGDKVEATFTVKAKDTSSNSKFTSFKASLNSYDGFWGYGTSTGPDSTWSANVTAPGEYTITVIAPKDITYRDNTLVIETGLTALPENYTLSGKTIKIAGREYDWSKAEAYLDVSGICLSLWDEWKDDRFGCPLEYSKNRSWTTSVNEFNEYTITGTATQNASSDFGTFFMTTDLKDIPSEYIISGKTIKIAGKEYDWSKAESYMYAGNACLFIWNAWKQPGKANPIDEQIKINAGDEIEATFTVKKKGASGDNENPSTTDNPASPSPTDNPAPPSSTDTPASSSPTDTPAPSAIPDHSKNPGGTMNPNPSADPRTSASLGKNKIFTSGSLKYKVTAAAKGNIPAKVSVIGLSASGNKKTSITVKNSVSYSGISYKVTTVGNNAFKNSYKLKKAAIGTNIASIPTNAFSGCKKLVSATAPGITKIGQAAFKNCAALKKLTLKKKISVKKGAFKGCKKTIKVTGGSKQINKANIKKLKKSGYKKFK